MSESQSSDTSKDATEIDRTAKHSATEEPESFQHRESNIGHELPKLLRSSEKVELWQNADISGNSRPLTDEANRFHQGWLAPYIEQDLLKTLRSSEKVEFWLRAHFSSQPISERFHEKEGTSVQHGEKTNAAQSVITSLAALEISF